MQALDQLFIAAPQLTGIALPYAEWRDAPQAMALFALISSDYVAREIFYQLPLWLGAERNRTAGQMQYDTERHLWYPQRPPRPDGEVYRRFDPNIKRTLSFRLPEVDHDAPQFTRWMNSPRVDAFWEMSGPLDVQAAYLQRQLDSPIATRCWDVSMINHSVISKCTGRRKTALAATTVGNLLTAVCTCWSVKRTGAARNIYTVGYVD